MHMSTTITKPASTATKARKTAEESAQDTVEPVLPNTIGKVALALAIVGFVMAVFMITAGLAWMLLIPAIGLAIAGLLVRNRRRPVAIAALIVAVIGLLVSLVGLRLPSGSVPDQEVIFNNDGVNPFSQLVLPGQEVGVGGVTTDGSATNADGVTVTVSGVDCHQPMANVTGLNITGEVCAITLTVNNNGTETITVDSSNVTVDANGSLIVADANLAEGDVLDATVLPGDTVTSLVYVNAPDGTTGVDGVSVLVGDDPDSTVTVDLG
jgi:hypothetical protein